MNGRARGRYRAHSFGRTPYYSKHRARSYGDPARGLNAATLQEDCAIYVRTGRCDNLKRCRYQHNPAHRALCQTFFRTGRCSSSGGGRCLLSHTTLPQNTPMCVHFARGNCTKSDCQFAHMTNLGSAPLSAELCRNFALNGWCSHGLACTRRHAFDCPEFESSGHCSDAKCRLQHTIRAVKPRVEVSSDNIVDIEMFIAFLERVDKREFDSKLYATSDHISVPEPVVENSETVSDESEDSSSAETDSDETGTIGVSEVRFDNDAEFVAL